MKILVTGASGFAGRWLVRELTAAGHETVAFPPRRDLDLARPDAHAMRDLIGRVRPDAVAHLAAVSFLPDAARDPAYAEGVNVGGTAALLDALEKVGSRAAVLVTSSADVYAARAELPIREEAPIEPVSDYGRTKVAQEALALGAAATRRVVITRAFNHIGPGQRPVFVVPQLAQRVHDVLKGRTNSITVGNLAARRDFTDVRDVVRAYRLVLERVAVTTDNADPLIVNIGSGRSVSIEDVLLLLCTMAGVEPRWTVDSDRLRANDIPDRVADATRLRDLTGWSPAIPLETSVRDVLESAAD